MEHAHDCAEIQPFIDQKGEKLQPGRVGNSPPSCFITRKNLLIHAILIALYTLTFILSSELRKGHYVFLHDALQDLNVRIRPTLSITTGESPWVGDPGGPADEAWHQLVGNTSIRATDEELRRNGNHQASVPLPEGGGNLVWLGVYHQIHCLKQFRHLNYLDYYHPNMTHDERYHFTVHANHCIEYLRQALMCNPDTSLTTLVWTETDPRPVLDVKQFERKCVEWEYFMESITPRVVPYEEVSSLVNPLFKGSA